MNKDYDEFNIWAKNRLTKDDIYSAIFEGMTNGEVIQAVFGYKVGFKSDLLVVQDDINVISVYIEVNGRRSSVRFEKDWWNSPYSEGSE